MTTVEKEEKWAEKINRMEETLTALDKVQEGYPIKLSGPFGSAKTPYDKIGRHLSRARAEVRDSLRALYDQREEDLYGCTPCYGGGGECLADQ